MQSPSEKLLERLQGVKQTAAGRWIARCPAHEDKSPSLSIRETADGRLLLYDFAGCEVSDVLAALGLEFSDLFDKPLARHLLPIRAQLNARELIEVTAHEITVAAMLVTYATQRSLTHEEMDRLNFAAARLGKAQAIINAR